MAKRKIKVATRYSHSIPKLVCLDGDNGLLISTRYLNHILNINRSAMLMIVESGATLKEVIEEAAEAGLALPHSPYWWGLTIGGLLATGAHGSSLWGKGSAMHEYVVGLRIVTGASPGEGYAMVLSLDADHPDLDAAKVSLGVLGVVSQVILQLEPMFKRSITNFVTADSDLGEKAVEFGLQHEFGDMTWYPEQRKVVYRIDDRVSVEAEGNGVNDFIGFRPTLTLALRATRLAGELPFTHKNLRTEESQEAIGNAMSKCVDARVMTTTLMASAYGLTNNGLLFTGYPIIGYQNRLQSSGTCIDSLDDSLITSCPWDPRVEGEFFYQTSFSITLSKAKDFIQDVQKLRDLMHNSLCGLELYNGILIRYVKASSAYLGKEEDSLDFDITYYQSDDPMKPRLYEDVIEEIEQIGIFKYGGLPHWGKNRNIAFEGAIQKYPKAKDFLRVRDKYDPHGLFSNEWTNQALGLRRGVSIYKEGCALEGLCVCSEDTHCAPDKGYFCRPGKVYSEARVCTHLISQ
ncbi:hypothetical protein QJS04_geneDACA020738 [Acorus gramineus]|uniref:L-gulonolactone oxidase n=1 Tax=Acorus gramineus TaxID=55184 RepID=A0AAV9A1N9_ACOGR|nr:hypothetical protein QJS04_geneDACA020738 [Acorus gramineus]